MTQTKLIQESIEKINKLGTKRIPFFFMIDFEMKKPIIYPLDELPDHIWYDLNGVSNRKANEADSVFFRFEPNPVSKQEYTKAFARVQGHLQYGNTFLSAITIFVPRAIFPDKLKTGGEVLTQYSQGSAYTGTVNYSPGLFVESILNFGYFFGPVFFLIVLLFVILL